MSTKKYIFLASLIAFLCGCSFSDDGIPTRTHVPPTTGVPTSETTSKVSPSTTSKQTSETTTSLPTSEIPTSASTSIPTSTTPSPTSKTASEIPTTSKTSAPTSTSTSSYTSKPTSVIPSSSSTSVPTSSTTYSTTIKPTSSTSVPTTASTTYSTTIEPTSTTYTSIPTSATTSVSTSISSSSSTSHTSTNNVDISAIPVNFTAINDFHGQLDENTGEYEVGIAKMATYLKDRKAQGDILISSGDNYQGSLICNITKGQWVSEIFKDIGFDALTIGNHEFDWGIDAIKANETVLGQKMLGANIYQYPKVDGKWVKSDVGDSYKIVTLNEGSDAEVKVGIIGVIGKDQLSSITSLFVRDIVFLDPTDIVKDLAVSLREDQGCDVVVASYHADDPDESIADNVPGKTYKYVDACFMAHTHKYQEWTANGVPFIQGSAYSRGVSSAKFTYNKYTSTLSVTSYGYEYLNSIGLEEDYDVKTSLNALKAEYDSMFNDVIGTNGTGDEISTNDMARYFAKASYDKAITQGYDVDACMFNFARQPLPSGDFTFSNLFETHPFLNDLYIISITSKNFYQMEGGSYGMGYKRSGLTASSSDTTTRYNVLVFNYNGFHQKINDDYSRTYDKFPTAFVSGAPEPIKLNYNCVDAALEWLSTNHTIKIKDFSGSNFM